MKVSRNWATWVLWMLIAFAIALAALCGCSHLTVAPKPVIAREIAFDENTQNAGLIDCTAAGCIVTSGWMEKYKALEKEFARKIPADQHIKAEGNNFRVSYEVTNNFIDLQRSHRSIP